MRHDHQTEIKFQAAWNEYRPECSCGWTGSYYFSSLLAENQAKRHRAKVKKLLSDEATINPHPEQKEASS